MIPLSNGALSSNNKFIKRSQKIQITFTGIQGTATQSLEIQIQTLLFVIFTQILTLNTWWTLPHWPYPMNLRESRNCGRTINNAYSFKIQGAGSGLSQKQACDQLISQVVTTYAILPTDWPTCLNLFGSHEILKKKKR